VHRTCLLLTQSGHGQTCRYFDRSWHAVRLWVCAYPLKNFDLASRVAVLGEMEGWCPKYVRASYRRWFVEGKEVGAYDDNTHEARQLNIFGSPTFVVRGELFWGDDRLDDAIAWHTNGTLRPT
jgi:2-hydroxychromene-2-carboxylate isomerase